MQRRGTDAANVDVEFRRDLEKFRKEIAGKLGNPRQQEIFTATASSEIPGYVDRMRGHRIQQGEVARQTTRAAEDQTGINEIQADPYNEEVFLNSLQDRVLNLNAILTEQGVTDSTAREAALRNRRGAGRRVCGQRDPHLRRRPGVRAHVDQPQRRLRMVRMPKLRGARQ